MHRHLKAETGVVAIHSALETLAYCRCVEIQQTNPPELRELLVVPDARVVAYSIVEGDALRRVFYLLAPANEHENYVDGVSWPPVADTYAPGSSVLCDPTSIAVGRPTREPRMMQVAASVVSAERARLKVAAESWARWHRTKGTEPATIPPQSKPSFFGRWFGGGR